MPIDFFKNIQWLFPLLSLASLGGAIFYSFRAVDHGEQEAGETCWLLFVITILAATASFGTLL